MNMSTYSVPKPADMAATVKTLEDMAQKNGGKFSGDENSGSFSIERPAKVAGEYAVDGDEIKITITEKPFILPASMIEGAIKNFFK